MLQVVRFLQHVRGHFGNAQFMLHHLVSNHVFAFSLFMPNAVLSLIEPLFGSLLTFEKCSHAIFSFPNICCKNIENMNTI